MEPLSKDHAELIAIAGLARLANNDDMLMRFSALTGILPNDVRQAASDPGFLVGVLDFYLAHEPDLLDWAQADGMSPESIARARLALAPEDVSGFE